MIGQTSSPLMGLRVAGKYEIVRLLSIGGMASVYEAVDVQTELHVALKILHPHHAQRATVLRRFQLEAGVVSGLDPRYVAVPRDSGCSEGMHFLAMDLLVGEDLRQLLRRQKTLSVAQSVDVALDVCRGLGAAHARGLVHRDIKPSNIFIAHDVDGHRRAKLLDFGIAKYSGSGDSTDESSLLGTVGYMAPEQIVSSKGVDHRVDLYSLGLVLYEALTGAPVYEGDRTEILYEIVHGRSLTIDDFDRAVPRGLARAIVKSIARKPGDRHRDARTFASAIAAYAGNGLWRTSTVELVPREQFSAAPGDNSGAVLTTDAGETDSDRSEEGPVEEVSSTVSVQLSRTRNLAWFASISVVVASVALAAGRQHGNVPVPTGIASQSVAELSTDVPTAALATPGADVHSPVELLTSEAPAVVVDPDEGRPRATMRSLVPRLVGTADSSNKGVRPRVPSALLAGELEQYEIDATIQPGAVFASGDPYDVR